MLLGGGASGFFKIIAALPNAYVHILYPLGFPPTVNLHIISFALGSFPSGGRPFGADLEFFVILRTWAISALNL